MFTDTDYIAMLSVACGDCSLTESIFSSYLWNCVAIICTTMPVMPNCLMLCVAIVYLTVRNVCYV